MSRISLRSRAPMFLMFVAPLVLLKGTALLMGGGSAARVNAAPLPVQSLRTGDATLIETFALTPAEHEARRYASALVQKTVGESPFFYERMSEDGGSDGKITEPAPLAKLTLSGILTASGGSAAIINGRPCRVGDQIDATRYTVIQIDPRLGTVEVEDRATGQMITVTIDRSGTRPGR